MSFHPEISSSWWGSWQVGWVTFFRPLPGASGLWPEPPHCQWLEESWEKTWGECLPKHCSYSHLQQLHIHWHTHPISFSFDFESMKKVKRLLIFRKGEMVADNKLSPPSQCWQIAVLPWFLIRNVESSPHLNILSIIQRENLFWGVIQVKYLQCPLVGLLRFHWTFRLRRRPEATSGICLFGRINVEDTSLPASSQEMNPMMDRCRSGPAWKVLGFGANMTHKHSIGLQASASDKPHCRDHWTGQHRSWCPCENPGQSKFLNQGHFCQEHHCLAT